MRILFICDEYPPGKIGGIGTAVQLLARELVRLGHQVYVAGLYPFSYGSADHERDNGVEVWRLRYGYDFRGSDLLESIYRRLPGIIREKFNTRRSFRNFTAFVSSLINKEKIEVVEIADWNTFSLYAGFLVEWPLFNIPLILKSHGSHTYFADETNEKAKKLMHRIDKSLFNRADAHSAVSMYTAEKNRKLFGLKKEIRILYNAVQPIAGSDKVSRKKDQLLFAGSLVEKKGVHQLMRSWREVNKRLPQLRLVVAGKGKQDPLKTLLGKSALTSVTFTGHISREDLLRYFQESSIAVLPSYSETFGLVAIEAMATGCAVIFTTRSCGPEIVQHERTGLLVDPDDTEQIVRAIERLYNDDALREELVRNAEAVVRNKFDLTRSAASHLEFYEQEIKAFADRSPVKI